MASDMSFWSLEVKGGASTLLEVEQTVDVCRYIHVQNAALAPGPSDGPSTLSVITNGQECVLCTLSKSAMQSSLQMLCDGSLSFKNSAKASIHLSGLSTTSMPVHAYDCETVHNGTYNGEGDAVG